MDLFSFDLSQFFSASVGGVPILFAILVLVEIAKSFGLAGNGLRALAMVLGLAFGVGYEIATLGQPAGFAAWFAYIIFGIALGGLTFKSYDLAKDLITKIVTRAIGDYIGGEAEPFGDFTDSDYTDDGP